MGGELRRKGKGGNRCGLVPNWPQLKPEENGLGAVGKLEGSTKESGESMLPACILMLFPLAGTHIKLTSRGCEYAGGN